MSSHRFSMGFQVLVSLIDSPYGSGPGALNRIIYGVQVGGLS